MWHSSKTHRGGRPGCDLPREVWQKHWSGLRISQSPHPQVVTAFGGGSRKKTPGCSLQAVGSCVRLLSELCLVKVPSPTKFPRFAPPFEGGTRRALRGSGWGLGRLKSGVFLVAPSQAPPLKGGTRRALGLSARGPAEVSAIRDRAAHSKRGTVPALSPSHGHSLKPKETAPDEACFTDWTVPMRRAPPEMSGGALFFIHNSQFIILNS